MGGQPGGRGRKRKHDTCNSVERSGGGGGPEGVVERSNANDGRRVPRHNGHRRAPREEDARANNRATHQRKSQGKGRDKGDGRGHHRIPAPPREEDARANRRDKQQRKRQRRRASEDFDLLALSDAFAGFIIGSDAAALTLPPFTKHQCVQVKSLAAIYGLKMRVVRGGGGGSSEGIEGGDEGGACVIITKCPRTSPEQTHLPEGTQEMALARLLASEVRALALS